MLKGYFFISCETWQGGGKELMSDRGDGELLTVRGMATLKHIGWGKTEGQREC